MNKIKVGINLVEDDFDESLTKKKYDRSEKSIGGFFEYNYDNVQEPLILLFQYIFYDILCLEFSIILILAYHITEHIRSRHVYIHKSIPGGLCLYSLL